MDKKELFRRYLLFILSVTFNGFSIAVITRALLGTSPISSVPYVLSLISAPTLGQFTIYMNLIFILLEMILMGRERTKKKKYELMVQLPVTFFFGAVIDISMSVLSWLNPDQYLYQIITLLVGCFLLGVGISLSVKASVAMVTGEYLVNVISKKVHKEFGFVKVFFDVSLVIISIVLSFVFLGHIEGVREGTIAAALLVGPITHFVHPWWRFLNDWLNCSVVEEEVEAAGKVRPLVITIARECGSGGRLLGKMLAKELGLNYYDKELISMVAKESHLSEEYISDHEQRVPSSSLLRLIVSDYEAAPTKKSLNRADAIFVAQSRVIRRIAAKESCIIVGRLADYVLKDYPQESIVRVFCYTDPDDALERCVNVYGMTKELAQKVIADGNHQRITHYRYYTGQEWGDPHNYNLMINTGSMGLDIACRLVEKLYESKKERLEATA